MTDERSAAAIEARGLVKRYREFTALSGVDLTVGRGEVCGFLGPNGAGKSTTLRILARVERADEGTAKICGHEVGADGRGAARALGYMPERFATYDTLTVAEYLEFFLDLYLPRLARLGGAARRKVIADALELTGMTSRAEDPVGGLSKGQRQRVLLARTVLHDPAVLLLDEPTSGLDPRARAEFKAIVRELSRMGKAVLISSHVLPDLQDLCDEVVILVAGKVHAAGRMADIRAQLESGEATEVRLELLDESAATRALEVVSGLEGVSGATRTGTDLSLSLAGGRARMPELHRALVSQQLPVVAVEYRRASLEDVYLSLTAGVPDEADRPARPEDAARAAEDSEAEK